jgi:hypothetical protein
MVPYWTFEPSKTSNTIKYRRRDGELQQQHRLLRLKTSLDPLFLDVSKCWVYGASLDEHDYFPLCKSREPGHTNWVVLLL